MSKNISALLKELKEGLIDIYGKQLRDLYLYGSYARAEHQPDSDVDVMIVLDAYENYGQEINRTGELVSTLSLHYGISISRVIMTEAQWQAAETPLLRNIRIDGISA